jgi:DNA polymerase I
MPAFPRPLGPSSYLCLVDGSSYVFRAYHATPSLTRSDGLQVNAVLGFCTMLWRLLREIKSEATHLAIVFDAGGQTFRHKLYPQYKANRPSRPDDMPGQFQMVYDAVRAFDIALVSQEGVEADDLIATYAERAKQAGATVTIIGSDKDFAQLVCSQVSTYDPQKERVYGEDDVFTRFGALPSQMADVQALAGDTVDNVPGVPGIGMKNAAFLVRKFGDVEQVLAQVDGLTRPAWRKALRENAELMRLSKKLVTLDRAVPLAIQPEDLAFSGIDHDRLYAFSLSMEFQVFSQRVADAGALQNMGRHHG